MKFLIVGHSVEDHINYKGENQKVKPGGIFYSTAGFNFIKENDDEIFLLTSFESNNYYLFDFVYKNVNQKYFQTANSIPKIHLTVWEDKERHERYENLTEKLKIDVIDFNKFDGIFINMITGFDIDVIDIELIRKNYSGLIYLDVHSLARGMSENYIRDFRKIPDVDIWIKSVDIIQANENEIFTLSTYKDEFEIAFDILNKGAKIFLVTKGNKGARLFTIENGELFSSYIPSIKVDTKNKIGCGDIFGAIFFYHYVKYNNMMSSLKMANIASGCVASYDDINNIKNLKEDVFSRYN